MPTTGFWGLYEPIVRNELRQRGSTMVVERNLHRIPTCKQGMTDLKKKSPASFAQHSGHCCFIPIKPAVRLSADQIRPVLASLAKTSQYGSDRDLC